MGLSRGLLGDMLGVLVPFWGPRGVSWGTPGAILGGLGALLGLFGGVWEVSWGHLGAIDQKRGEHFSASPRRGPKSRLLGPSWAALGALLGALGPVLGLSWAPLGALLGHLGAILRPQEPIGSEKARRQTTLIFLRFWSDFCLSGASLGGSVATWSRLGAVLEPLVGMWGAISSHRGLS